MGLNEFVKHESTEIQETSPTIIKSRKGTPTVIMWNGKRYILDHTNKSKVKSTD